MVYSETEMAQALSIPAPTLRQLIQGGYGLAYDVWDSYHGYRFYDDSYAYNLVVHPLIGTAT